MKGTAKQDGTTGAEILDFVEFARKHTLQPASSEELEEYRRMWPLVMKMLKEWEAIKGAGGCPIAKRITDSD